MDIVAIKDFVPLRIFISMALGSGILLTPRWWLLAWIPLLPYSGIMLYSPDNPRGLMFISSYIELILCVFFIYFFLKNKKDTFSVLLFGIIFLSVPSLFNAGGHFLLSLFLFCCLLSGAGIYLYFKENMSLIKESNIVDIAVVVWIILGILIKIYIGIRLNEPWFVQRGGGIIGSNHVAGILFLLLPLVRSRLVAVFAVLFLVFQFSRGIYLALAIYLILWIGFVNARQAIRWTAYVISALVLFIGICGTLSFISEYGPVTINDFIISRLKMFHGINALEFINAILEDSRWDLFELAVMIGRQVSFTGIGFGGFSWALQDVNFPFLFTNAHNIYLTLLVEGGFLFFLGFTGLLVFILLKAFKENKMIFVGVLTWAVYGLYSGEIYETGGMASAGDYYTFIFAASCLNFRKAASSTLAVNEA